PRAVGARRREPALLLGERVRLGEDVLLVLLEILAPPGRDREATDLEPIDDLFARGIVVGPGPVVEGGRRRDLDRVAEREPDRGRARVTLGAAHDIEAVALDD